MVARPGWHRPSECPRTYCRKCDAVLFAAMSGFDPDGRRGLSPEPETSRRLDAEPEPEVKPGQPAFDFGTVEIPGTGPDAAATLTALAPLARGADRAAILCAAILVREAPTLALARRRAWAWQGPHPVKARLIELFGEVA